MKSNSSSLKQKSTKNNCLLLKLKYEDETEGK